MIFRKECGKGSCLTVPFSGMTGIPPVHRHIRNLAADATCVRRANRKSLPYSVFPGGS